MSIQKTIFSFRDENDIEKCLGTPVQDLTENTGALYERSKDINLILDGVYASGKDRASALTLILVKITEKGD